MLQRTDPTGYHRAPVSSPAPPPDLDPSLIETLAVSLADSLVATETAFEQPIAGSSWTARRTLDHLADALVLYAAYVATRATARRPPLRDGRAAASGPELLGDITTAATILRRLLDVMGPAERAFHPAGPADQSGWVAMACDELLVHGLEVATAVDVTFDPDPAIVDGIVQRLFPWTPNLGTPVERLLWANGRQPLGDHDQLDPLWYWWCRPLAEWDGHRHTRSAPPAW